MRCSCRPCRLRSTVLALSVGGSAVQIASRVSWRICWLALTWAIRKFPVSRAASNVFLTVHGIGGEHHPAQSQLTDHLLGSGDLVRFIVDFRVGEDNGRSRGEGRQRLNRLAVVDVVEAAVQRL